MTWINWLNDFCVLHARLQTIGQILDQNRLIDLVGIIKKLIISKRSVNIEERIEENEWIHIGWYENGQVKYEHDYKNGKKHGIHRGWHENGQLAYKDDFVNGCCHGTRKSWHENGQIKADYNYVNGHPHGLCTVWYSDGKIQTQGIYYQSVKVGNC